MTETLDGRLSEALQAELLRRAQATLSGDGRGAEPGPIANAILARTATCRPGTASSAPARARTC